MKTILTPYTDRCQQYYSPLLFYHHCKCQNNGKEWVPGKLFWPFAGVFREPRVLCFVNEIQCTSEPSSIDYYYCLFIFGCAGPWLICRLFSSCGEQGLLSLRWLLLLRSKGSIVVVHRLSCPVACGILRDQGLNPCLLHWQTDSLPLSHQGSPSVLECLLQ